MNIALEHISSPQDLNQSNDKLELKTQTALSLGTAKTIRGFGQGPGFPDPVYTEVTTEGPSFNELP